MPLDPNIKRLPVDVPIEEHRRFKILSAQSEVHMKDAALRGLHLWEKQGGRLPSYQIRVWGYIPGGPSYEVRPLEECYVNVDEEFMKGLNGNEYFLIVDGHSMCSDKSDSIESGEYALFRPGLDPCSKIAHVEWSDESGTHQCTLKRYCCDETDMVTLRPANPDYEPIFKKKDEIAVRGIFVRKWSPKTS